VPGSVEFAGTNKLRYAFIENVNIFVDIDNQAGMCWQEDRGSFNF